MSRYQIPRGTPPAGALITRWVGKIAIFDGNRRLPGKRYEIGSCLLWNDNKKSLVPNRMVSFSMTWSEANPGFKVTVYLQVGYLQNGASYGQCYYRTLIRNHTQSIEGYHFQWPWVTFDPNFKVTTFFKSNIWKTAPLKDKVTIAH